MSNNLSASAISSIYRDLILSFLKEVLQLFVQFSFVIFSKVF